MPKAFSISSLKKLGELKLETGKHGAHSDVFKDGIDLISVLHQRLPPKITESLMLELQNVVRAAKIDMPELGKKIKVPHTSWLCTFAG